MRVLLLFSLPFMPFFFFSHLFFSSLHELNHMHCWTVFYVVLSWLYSVSGL